MIRNAISGVAHSRLPALNPSYLWKTGKKCQLSSTISTLMHLACQGVFVKVNFICEANKSRDSCGFPADEDLTMILLPVRDSRLACV